MNVHHDETSFVFPLDVFVSDKTWWTRSIYTTCCQSRCTISQGASGVKMSKTERSYSNRFLFPIRRNRRNGFLMITQSLHEKYRLTWDTYEQYNFYRSLPDQYPPTQCTKILVTLVVCHRTSLHNFEYSSEWTSCFTMSHYENGHRIIINGTLAYVSWDNGFALTRSTTVLRPHTIIVFPFRSVLTVLRETHQSSSRA